ncbi:putative ATP-dependent helicase Lhr [Planctomycetes bacterium Pan216]|uniref:Putative ATP-dependent helicase Lhr n=1 Tax=Kolteria novifilia TaxID=2527975 RepID=A0A518B1Y1_9BACT|nr:putative ATP-dependent helicase Lhr [Planctomycetes bacterium Pan216]
MDVDAVIAELIDDSRFPGRKRLLRTLPGREASYATPDPQLPDGLRSALERLGIERLYTHQVAALEHARSGRSIVTVTGTASGKSLCYNLPVLEQSLLDPQARALYLFPTKALSRDQLGGLERLAAASPDLRERIRPDVFDGDTPTARRRAIKERANVVMTNPDMLHVSLLPQHPKWSRFFADLRVVVLDEVHTYRGIFGSHVANVLRRLRRICHHYGSDPVVLATSATVGNPGPLTEELIGAPVSVVEENGAPCGPKHIFLWSPAEAGLGGLALKSASDEAVLLLQTLLRHQGRAITFTRTRLASELVYRGLTERLAHHAPGLASKVKAYRGGYLPDERRAIERDLFEGRLQAIVSTNALELGIDVGSLDAAVLIGYPGTIASTWQQMGRAGRRAGPSVSILIAQSDPIDQFMLRHPDYFFEQSPEAATLDAENPYILSRHLSCAAFELPLDEDDPPRFGPKTQETAEQLQKEKRLTETGGAYYWARPDNPAVGVSLRHMADNTFSIIERRPEGEVVIANVDAISAPELVYPEAVYLHAAETYLVRELDLEGKIARVERLETDYYTQAILESNIKLRERRRDKPWGDGEAGFGMVDVTWKTVAFKKIKFETRENLGMGPVDIPEQTLPTTGLWLAMGPETRALLKSMGYRPSEALAGTRNLFVMALPLLAMCDVRDISGVVDSSNLGTSALFVYDRYPHGLGYAERGYEQLERLLEMSCRMVEDCGCEEGCPSCVGLPNLRPAIHADPDLSRGYPIPDKGATLCLLRHWTGRSLTGEMEVSPAMRGETSEAS